MNTPEHAKSPTRPVIGSRYEMVTSFGITPTCNGGKHSARISNFSARFATVTDRETGKSAEFSWEAVRNVMEAGGDFQL